MEMPMYFVDELPSYVLFRDWAPRRTRELVWTSFVILGIAVSLEGIRRLREVVKIYDLRDLKLLEGKQSCCVNLDCGNGAEEAAPNNSYSSTIHSKSPNSAAHNWSKWRLLFRRFHLVQTLLLGVQTTLGYFLMLAAMTYNVWIFVAMVGGTVVGHFFFAWNNL